jgi:DNA mismatch repair protein MSH4
VRTLTKIAVLNPSDIITPNGISSFSNADPSMTKLYSDVAGKFPGASIIEVHRKYFSETRGLQMVKHLCALEYSSVELQLRHKYYALAAAACLLKYVEFIENIIYAPKVSTVKLGDKEHFEKEQIDVKELFPMAKC